MLPGWNLNIDAPSFAHCSLKEIPENSLAGEENFLSCN
jgi:hypothetical protein